MFVKICGITSEEDALLAVAMDADAIGFIFAPSPRQMSATAVADIVKRLPPEIPTVGVFRDESAERVIDIVQHANLKGAQLHGREGPDVSRWVRERLGLVIKAFPAGDPALDHADDWGADAVLVDSPSPGSGQMFDWALAEGAPIHRRVILAGGLTPENVGDAISRVRPWGVDVATGVESDTGRKDARKVREFIANARAAEPERYRSDEPVSPFDWRRDPDQWR